MIKFLKLKMKNRSLVLVGLMGVGKSTIGRYLADVLDLRFCDSDHEIEVMTQLSIKDFFAVYGEQVFRNLEEEVICRLLKEGPIVLATGGGAFMNAKIREIISKYGLSIWLQAESCILIERLLHEKSRPLLEGNKPDLFRRLISERYPIYARADITVQNHNVLCDLVVFKILEQIKSYLIA
ncbi:MAG: shikimate kinase [Candidatus Tokpelaia sp. JSC161]|nr:MAG: shikimate kinase [Candidatus Tokpelaia sp. JSC161]